MNKKINTLIFIWLFFGVSVSLLYYQQAVKNHQSIEKNKFISQMQKRDFQISEKLRAKTKTLSYLRSFFNASHTVSKSEFMEFSKTIINSESISSLCWRNSKTSESFSAGSQPLCSLSDPLRSAQIASYKDKMYMIISSYTKSSSQRGRVSLIYSLDHLGTVQTKNINESLIFLDRNTNELKRYDMKLSQLKKQISIENESNRSLYYNQIAEAEGVKLIYFAQALAKAQTWVLLPMHFFMMALGILVTFLIAIFVFVMSIQKSKIDRKVAQQTAEITRNMEEIEAQRRISFHQSKLASIGELASGVGHEINNPLAIVLGHAEKLKSKNLASTDQIMMSVEKISKAGNRIKDIVEGLRNFSRADAEKHEWFSLLEAVEETFHLLDGVYTVDGIKISFEASITKDICIFGNRGRFNQVIMNLISNAKSACKLQKNPHIQIKVTEKNDRTLEVAIIDNGSGIPDKIQNKVFEPFFTTKKHGEGTGIGLSLTQTFVTELGGTISFESSMEKGTTFYIIFDASHYKSQESTQPSTTEPTDTYKISETKKILIVDDEEDILDYLVDIISQTGHQTAIARNGIEALKIITSETIDVVISDIKMPEMNGIELVTRIKSLGELNPYIAIMTGGVNIENFSSKNELETLAHQVLFKPFASKDILAILKAAEDFHSDSSRKNTKKAFS